MTLDAGGARGRGDHGRLDWLQVALLALNLVLIAIVILNGAGASRGLAVGSTLLTQRAAGRLFLAGAIGVGIACTLVLAGIAVSTGSDSRHRPRGDHRPAGHFFVFFSILRAGSTRRSGRCRCAARPPGGGRVTC